MKDDIFDTKDKVDSAISEFTNLMNSAGWKLFIEILNANIKVVENRILTGTEGETKNDIDRLRDKLEIYKSVRNTPQTLIDNLKGKKTETPNIDPYDI